MSGSRLTESILENIESGRKADLSISQLLNIARALRVPPSYLLSPITSPHTLIDLPNLSDDLSHMTAAQFDSWLSGTPSSSYISVNAEERIAIDQLNAFRERQTLLRELTRLGALCAIELDSNDSDLQSTSAAAQRLVSVRAAFENVDSYLNDAGWTLNRLPGDPGIEG